MLIIWLNIEFLDIYFVFHLLCFLFNVCFVFCSSFLFSEPKKVWLKQRKSEDKRQTFIIFYEPRRNNQERKYIYKRFKKLHCQFAKCPSKYFFLKFSSFHLISNQRPFSVHHWKKKGCPSPFFSLLGLSYVSKVGKEILHGKEKERLNSTVKDKLIKAIMRETRKKKKMKKKTQ